MFRFRSLGSLKFLSSDNKDNVLCDERGDDKYTIWKLDKNKLFYKMINGANGGFLTSRPNGEVYLTDKLDSDPLQEWAISVKNSTIENRKTGFWLTTDIKGIITTNVRSRKPDSDDYKLQLWRRIPYNQDISR